jgi:DNA primase
MKIRNDSPFAKLTKEQGEKLLELSKTMSMESLVKVVEGAPEPIHCSIPAMRRYLKRIEQEQLIEDANESEETVAILAKKGENPGVRDAALAAMRQRMFESAFQTNNREMLMEMFRELNEEKAEDRAQALEERKVKVAEENAKLGWRKLECENARAGLKVLPKIHAILTDATKDSDARVAEALVCLGSEGAQLLTSGSAAMLPMGRTESRAAA